MSHRLHRNGRGSQHQTGEPSMASQSNSVSGSKSRKRRRKDESAQNSESASKRSRLSRSSPTGNTRTGNTEEVVSPGVKTSERRQKESSMVDTLRSRQHGEVVSRKDEQPRSKPNRKRSSSGDSNSMEGVKRTRLDKSFHRSSVNKDNQKQKTVHTNRSKALTSEQHADTVRTQKRLPSNAAGTVTEKTTMGTSSKQATNAASSDITPSESQVKQVEGEPSKSDKQATNAASSDITPSESQVKQVEGEPSKSDKQATNAASSDITPSESQVKQVEGEPSKSDKQATNAASSDITPSESQVKQVEGEPSKSDKQNRYDRKAEHQTEQATTKPDKEKKKRKRAEQNPAPGKPRGPGNLKRKSVPKKEVWRRSTPGKHRECRKWPTPKWQKPITDFPLQRINIISSSPANSQETQGESSTQHSTVSEVPLQSTDVGELEPSSQESNIQQRTLTQKSAEKDAKSKLRRRRRCGKCENCCMPDCGECNNCRCVDLYV